MPPAPGPASPPDRRITAPHHEAFKYELSVVAATDGTLMAEAIFKVPSSNASKLTTLTGDDTVSRQSITTRDAASLGMEGDVLYVRVTGSDDGVDRAKTLATENDLGDLVTGDEATKVAKAIDEQEESAAEGMGLIDF